jgi:hypothetical protein
MVSPEPILSAGTVSVTSLPSLLVFTSFAMDIFSFNFGWAAAQADMPDNMNTAAATSIAAFTVLPEKLI